MKKLFTVILIALFTVNGFAYPWGHRYEAEQSQQNIVADINTSFTVSVEWGEGGWDGPGGTMFGYGLSTDGSGWIWVELPWFQDGSGSNKRCKTSVSIPGPGKYYYAYRMIKAASGGTSYSYGTSDWAENVATLNAYATLTIGKVSKANGEWSLATNWEGDVAPVSTDNVAVMHNMAISSAASAATVYVYTGKTLTINNGYSLSVSGALANNAGVAGLVVKSGGSLIQSSGSVQATVERDIPAWIDDAHGWHFLSAPVAAQSIDPAFTDVTPANYDFYTWWEPTNVWVNYKNTTVAPVWNTANVLGGTSGGLGFIPGKGYLVAYANSSTRQFTGTLNTTDITLSNFAISSGANNSWHLLGNPFSSALTWGTGWSLNNINATAKVWRESTASYVDIASGGFIPALNGFMIQVNEGFGGNNSLTIPAASRVHDATAWYKSTENSSIVLLANDPAGLTSQESIIRIHPEASGEFDPDFDAHFLPGFAPSLYSSAGDEMYSTNTLPSLPAETVIPFGFVKNGASDFSVELKESIDGYIVFLTDVKTSTEQNLTSNPVYAFTSETGDDPNRFLLHFAPVGVANNAPESAINIFTMTDAIYITGAPVNASVLVSSLSGQVVLRSTVNGNGLTIVNSGALTGGVYIVSVVTAATAVNRKVVVR